MIILTKFKVETDDEEKMDECHNHKQLDVNNVEHNQKIQLLPSNELLIALFEDFMHFGSVGLHIVDENGIILWANQAELDLLGYTKEEYFGQPISIIHSNMNCLNDLLTTYYYLDYKLKIILHQ